MDVQAADIQTYIVLSKLLMLVVPATAVINILVSIWAGRRRPNIAEELYRDFASKKDLSKVTAEQQECEKEHKAAMRELRLEFKSTMAEYFQRQHINQSAIDDKFQAIMQSIGEINGQLKKCPDLCGQEARRG
jgi:hypothetical protein